MEEAAAKAAAAGPKELDDVDTDEEGDSVEVGWLTDTKPTSWFNAPVASVPSPRSLPRGVVEIGRTQTLRVASKGRGGGNRKPKGIKRKQPFSEWKR